MVQRRSCGKQVDSANAYVVDGLRTRLGNWGRLRGVSGCSGHDLQSALVSGLWIFGSVGFSCCFFEVQST